MNAVSERSSGNSAGMQEAYTRVYTTVMIPAASLVAVAVVLASLPVVPVGAQSTGAPPPAASAPAWPADDAGLAALGTRLTEEWMRAIAAADAAALGRIMHEGFQRVGYDGACDRAAELAAVAAMGAKDPKITDVKATRVGDALVVTCQAAVAQTVGGAALDAKPASRIGVWVPAAEGWKLAAWASLHMPASRPAPGAPRIAGEESLNKSGGDMVLRFLEAQRSDPKAFDAMMADGMQVVNFRGQKAKADLVQGAARVKADAPAVADARATRCGGLTVVSCTLTMAQHMGFTSLPADPAPFLAVFEGTGDGARVIALANTNKPR